MATAAPGAGADNFQGAWPAWHHTSAVGAFVVNLVVALVELRAIVRNGRLIDGVLARIGAPIS